jgi:hypothetical protein
MLIVHHWRIDMGLILKAIGGRESPERKASDTRRMETGL